MSFEDLLDQVPAATSLPGFDDLEALCAGLADDGVPLHTLGTSREGRPIRLLSPGGAGPLNALVVGTPHPNEPIGGLTLAFLVQALQRAHPALTRLPFRWHFIPTIEPDGLVRNQGWLASPHNAEAYFSNFFRPALDEQAEYTFPLQSGGHAFDHPTPENLAWQAAIERTQPDLLVSLHNAEHGGAFYVLSRDEGGLAARLSARPPLHGIAVDEQGDPLAEMLPMARGVFQALDFAALVPQRPDAWQAGQSSFGHCARHGTLGLIAEVPYWQEAPVDAAAEPEALREVFRPALLACQQALSIMVPVLPALAPALHGPARGQLRAVREGVMTLERVCAALARLPAATMPAATAHVQRRGARLLPLRTLSMFAQLCDELCARPAASIDATLLQAAARAAWAQLRAELRDPALRGGMQPVPLRDAVALQVEAVLMAAEALAARRSA
jgi:hypothetical protein